MANDIIIDAWVLYKKQNLVLPKNTSGYCAERER